MKTPLHHRVKTTLHHMSPIHIAKRASTAKIMRRFADSIGLVYFGFVDQQDDEHRLVRGITASSTHSDHHYTVGTFKGYDVSFVVRRDTLVYPDRRIKDHFWTIVTVDLHTTLDMPSVYIGNHTSRETFLSKYATLSALPFAMTDPQLWHFQSTHTLYGQLDREYETYDLLATPILQAFAEHAGTMSVEIADGTLYVYQTEKHPSRALLTTMLNFGIWFAEAIDAQAVRLAD